MKIVLTTLAFVFLLTGCQMTPAKSRGRADGSADTGNVIARYQRITAEEAYEMMNGSEVVVVDVRTLSEYNEGHIKEAVLLPNESIGDTMPAQLPDPNATLLIYCRSGRRSKEASEKLLALGYKNVYDFGGIIDWPYDTVKE